MRRSEGLLALVLAPAVLAAAPAPAADPAPVIAAERAFAARAGEVGLKQSFLENLADDAVVFAPEPTSAKAVYQSRPDGKGPSLAWWPAFAGIAASGDLGFTTGPYEVNGKRAGHYFTVWKRQPDGAWKWVYDGGADSDATQAQGPEAPVAALPPPTGPRLYPEAAFAKVRGAEAQLARRAAKDLAGAYKAALAPDARVQGSAAPPAATPQAVARELANRPATAEFVALGGEASKAGDLAWTYGEVRWVKDSAPQRGHYVRIWQSRAPGWRLVFDQILAVPPAPQSKSN